MARKVVSGDKEILRNLKKARKLYPEAVLAAVWAEGIELANRVKRRIPVEFGVLKNSLYLFLNRREKNVELGVGTDYAIYVHEMVQNKHTQGSAKFISIPFNGLKRVYVQRLAKRSSEFIKRGVKLPSSPHNEKPRTQ